MSAAPARPLAGLDLSADNAALADCVAERARLAAGMAKAEARIAEINAALSTIAQARHSAAVADALLSDMEAEQAAAIATNERDLRNELAALRSGVRELEERQRAVEVKISEVRAAATGRLAGPLLPEIDRLTNEARAGAAAIARAYAGLAAIERAARLGGREAGATGAAVARLMHCNAPLIGRATVLPVPDDVAAVLADLETLGPVIGGSVPTHVTVPGDHETAGLITAAVMSARAAIG